MSYHKTYDVICVIDFAAEYIDHLEQHQKSKFIQKQRSGFEEFGAEMKQTFSPSKMQTNTGPDFGTMYKESPTKSLHQMQAGSAQMNKMFSNMADYQSKQQPAAHFMTQKQQPMSSKTFGTNFQSKPSNLTNFNDFDIDDDFEWPEGAIKCKEKKHSKVIGNMKITKVTKLFLMKDGKTEIIENTLKELM